MELDMELEAEFDAQAFGPELRALKVRLDDSGSSFVLTATVPWTAEPARALDRVKTELLREDEACFVLFRTRTWALISFTPPDAPGPECALYDASCAKLQALLGGESRVPNVRRWASLAEVQLDEQVPPRVAVSAASLHARRVRCSACAARASAAAAPPLATTSTTYGSPLPDPSPNPNNNPNPNPDQVELALPCSYRSFGDATGGSDPAAVASYIRGGNPHPNPNPCPNRNPKPKPKPKPKPNPKPNPNPNPNHPYPNHPNPNPDPDP